MPELTEKNIQKMINGALDFVGFKAKTINILSAVENDDLFIKWSITVSGIDKSIIGSYRAIDLKADRLSFLVGFGIGLYLHKKELSNVLPD